MIQRRTPKHPKRLFAADTALLREAFANELHLGHGAAGVPSVSGAYREWLSSHGIEPDTGHMTEEGLAFFRTCLEKKSSGASP